MGLPVNGPVCIINISNNTFHVAEDENMTILHSPSGCNFLQLGYEVREGGVKKYNSVVGYDTASTIRLQVHQSTS